MNQLCTESVYNVYHFINHSCIVLYMYKCISGADPGGGGPGVQGPPLVPREGVLDPSSKMKKTAFIIFN